VRYLAAQQGSTLYIAATLTWSNAAQIILSTGQPTMALGGFLGTDPILTPEKLVGLVEGNTVRFFWLEYGAGDQPLVPGERWGGFQPQLTAWIESNCTAVPASAWLPPEPTTAANQTGQPSGAGQQARANLQQQLYDCAPTP